MSAARPVRILVTGGGTAGHVYPVLAVIDALRQQLAHEHRSGMFLFVGRRASNEAALVANADVPFVGISGGKLRRYVDIQNILDPFRLMLGFFQALGIMARFRPNVVFAKGGYVTVPVAWAATLFRVPVVAHESDVVIGLANRLIARVAKVVCVSYPVDEYQGQAIGNHVVYTGNPVRSEFFSLQSTTRTKPPYTLLVMGGSQGAQAINRSLSALLQEQPATLNIIHVTGPANFQEFASNASTTYHPIAFTDHLVDLFNQADVVISRAGGSVFELAAAGLPSILIPLTFGSRGEQRVNAAYFARHHAAIVIDEANVTPEIVRSRVLQLLKNVEERQSLSKAIRQLAIPDAAQKVADEVLKLVQPRSRK